MLQQSQQLSERYPGAIHVSDRMRALLFDAHILASTSEQVLEACTWPPGFPRPCHATMPPGAARILMPSPPAGQKWVLEHVRPPMSQPPPTAMLEPTHMQVTTAPMDADDDD